LCDGRAGLRGGLQVEAIAPSDQPAIIDFIASSEALDRYDEIIAANGWQLDNYRRNPVFQNAHQYGDIIFTLGKALITEIRSGGTSSASPYLFQRIEFAIDVNPMARIAYGLYKGKFLNAVSVGFIPIRWLDGDGNERSTRSHAPTLPRSGASSLRTPHSAVRTYLEQELLEVSAVGIPANPDALALAFKSGAIEKADLRDLADLLRQTLTSPTNPISGSNPEAPANPAQLLQLARDLRNVMRHT
jgi:hypothetical protein